MYYINVFFVYSILGFLVESGVYKLIDSNIHSGFLFGPITPIYGIGAIIILLINKYFFNKIKNKFIRIPLQFLFFIVLLTLIEYLGGILLKEVMNMELWNYSSKEYSLGKYISIDTSLIWGIFSIIFIYLIHPFMNKVIKKIPKLVTYLGIIIFFIDIICTVMWKR